MLIRPPQYPIPYKSLLPGGKVWKNMAIHMAFFVGEEGKLELGKTIQIMLKFSFFFLLVKHINLPSFSVQSFWLILIHRACETTLDSHDDVMAIRVFSFTALQNKDKNAGIYIHVLIYYWREIEVT
jgi:hypothetical protein